MKTYKSIKLPCLNDPLTQTVDISFLATVCRHSQRILNKQYIPQ